MLGTLRPLITLLTSLLPGGGSGFNTYKNNKPLVKLTAVKARLLCPDCHDENDD